MYLIEDIHTQFNLEYSRLNNAVKEEKIIQLVIELIAIHKIGLKLFKAF